MIYVIIIFLIFCKVTIIIVNIISLPYSRIYILALTLFSVLSYLHFSITWLSFCRCLKQFNSGGWDIALVWIRCFVCMLVKFILNFKSNVYFCEMFQSLLCIFNYHFLIVKYLFNFLVKIVIFYSFVTYALTGVRGVVRVCV